MRLRWLALLIPVLTFSGCTLEAPLDPADVGGDFAAFLNQLGRRVENAVRNPLDQKLNPQLLGGDSTRIFYATNLGDVRITFPGPTNDWVIPGVLGPSNLYVYHEGERRLLRPLVPAGALSRLDFDGDSVVFVLSHNIGTPQFTEQVIVSGSLFDHFKLLEVPLSDGVFITDLEISGGRVAVLLAALADGVSDELRLYDLAAPESPILFTAQRIEQVALRGDRLAYVADGERIVLYDHITRTTTEFPAGDSPTDVTLTDNHVVWGQLRPNGARAVYAYAIPTGTMTLWADAVDGRIAGATDEYFITETSTIGRNNVTWRIVIRRYDSTGAAKTLADFRADGLAGQTMVMGDRVVFVNAEARIVVVPFQGGGRFNFRP